MGKLIDLIDIKIERGLKFDVKITDLNEKEIKIQLKFTDQKKITLKDSVRISLVKMKRFVELK